ncbi:MAG: choice-of-anchor Q domain-containing protein, partial [Lentisphaerota bacterium]
VWATDLDGGSRTNGAAVDMGADEFDQNSLTGLLSVAVESDYSNAVAGAVLTFASDITGMAQGFSWTSGDAGAATNVWLFRHAWTSTGSFPVVLTAWNAAMTASATTLVLVVQGFTNFVSQEGAHLPPFTNWLMAATNIQDAIDALTVVGGTILVTNGIYDTGEKSCMGLRNRIAVLMPACVRSVNGPFFSTIRGHQSDDAMQQCRSAYVAEGATLSGFTVSNGQTYEGDVIPVVSSVLMCGGGIYCEEGGTVLNCIVRDNSALLMGGGVFGGAIRNSVMIGNTCSNYGGGAAEGIWRNCTIIGNQALEGGGVYGGMGHNIIVMDNLAEIAGDNFASNTFLTYSCSTPLPPGSNNMVLDPQWVSTGVFCRLSPSSPCIDGGINGVEMHGETDLEGMPRILNGTVDLGAYEFHFDLQVKAFLQGPYKTNEHDMSKGLNDCIPAASPYVADSHGLALQPSNAVDWVLIQASPGVAQSPLFSRSASLGRNGWVMSDAGTAPLLIEVSPMTTNYLVVSHRNHVSAMSALPMVFTNQALTYDFTTGPDQYYGGTNASVQLEPGVWGMMAGDADGDGKITAVDKAICEQQAGMSGYLSGDFDLDGYVGGEP